VIRQDHLVQNHPRDPVLHRFRSALELRYYLNYLLIRDYPEIPQVPGFRKVHSVHLVQSAPELQTDQELHCYQACLHFQVIRQFQVNQEVPTARQSQSVQMVQMVQQGLLVPQGRHLLVCQVNLEDPVDLDSLRDQVVLEFRLFPGYRLLLEFLESPEIRVCRLVHYFPSILAHLELQEFPNCRQGQKVLDYPQAQMGRCLH